MTTHALFSLAALTFALSACTGPASHEGSTGSAKAAVSYAEEEEVTPSGPVIATYGGKEFTEGHLRAEIAKLNKRARKSLEDPERRKQFVENHILSNLIYAEGRRRGFDTDAQIAKQLSDLQRRLVIQKVMQEHQSAPVSDEDVRAYYDTHADEFRTDRVKASHILVKEEDLAKEIAAKLKESPDTFAALAEEHSIDKSNAARGGDLGFFGRGRMVKEFEEAAFGLTEDGQISDIVSTRFGHHIIKRSAREDGSVKPFEEVQNQIRIRLINDKRREQTEAFLASLKESAKFSLNTETLAAADLSGLPEPPQVKPAGGHGH